MRSRFVLATCSFITVLAVTFALGQSTEQNSAIESMKEAVFRYQMTHCLENNSARVFLLSEQGKDLSDEFMKRFSADAERVKKGSEKAESEDTHEFVDKESGKSAVLLSIDKFKVTTDDHAEVEGSCGFASWAARGYKYSLVREKKEWKVKRAEPGWVL